MQFIGILVCLGDKAKLLTFGKVHIVILNSFQDLSTLPSLTRSFQGL